MISRPTDKLSLHEGENVLNIVVPMAGRGSRFAEAGFKTPKPLIEIHGEPMIKWVIENLRPECEHQFIFIAQEEHINSYSLNSKIEEWSPGAKLLGINGISLGAADTVLAAKELINSDEPLLIANSDQWIRADINEFLEFKSKPDLDGSIMTMAATDKKWSYAQVNQELEVIRVAEKEVISRHATVGIYGFTKGKFFVRAAERMILESNFVNGEAYVAPVYNLLISDKAKFNIFEIGEVGTDMFGLGTPDDLQIFLQSPYSKKVKL